MAKYLFCIFSLIFLYYTHKFVSELKFYNDFKWLFYLQSLSNFVLCLIIFNRDKKKVR